MPQKLKPSDSLIEKIDSQSRQIELLRKKIFVLQEALIRNSGMGICDLNHPLASIAPIERRFFSDVDRTVVIFGGMLPHLPLGMPPAEFLKSFMNRKINVLFLKDFKQCWYQQGLLGMSESIETTLELIKSLIPSNQKISTLGLSSGGFAAILFGAMLKADNILAFGPQTNITEKIYHLFKSVDSRRDEIDLMNKYLDLERHLELTHYSGLIQIHFALDNENDKKAAEHIAHLKCVKTHSYPTGDHNIARWLKKNKLLNSILDEFLL